MTAVEKLGIGFREWQRKWDNYDGKKEPKPISFDEFMKPFLAMEKQQAHEYAEFAIMCDRKEMKILNFDGFIKLD
tara:strand:+ start:664 stop:888 length:225 start_codon:yes stop_codon:yes gene_type:complete